MVWHCLRRARYMSQESCAVQLAGISGFHLRIFFAAIPKHCQLPAAARNHEVFARHHNNILGGVVDAGDMSCSSRFRG